MRFWSGYGGGGKGIAMNLLESKVQAVERIGLLVMDG